MHTPKKTDQDGPKLTSFKSADEVLRYYSARATPEDLEKLKRFLASTEGFLNKRAAHGGS